MLRKVKIIYSCFAPYTAHIAEQRKVPKWSWDPALSKELSMSVLSNTVEANSYFGCFFVVSLIRSLIVLSAKQTNTTKTKNTRCFQRPSGFRADIERFAFPQ